MAELILSSVVRSITGQLVPLVANEIGLASCVKGELKKLQDTVSSIEALLREAEKRRVQSEDVKDWLEKLKDVVYDADDLMDDFSIEVQRRRRGNGRGKRILNEVRIFFSSSNQLAYSLKMAHRVKEIRERIDAIDKDKVRFQLGGDNISTLGSSAEVINSRETSAYEPDGQYVIGRDEDKKKVIEFLLNADLKENVSILPIVGFGGLGKTTLARLVFNDERVKEHFQLKLWVCISTNFNVDGILKKILGECTPSERLGDVSMNELHKKIREQLDGKKFLLVLDDVWNENQHEWLKLERFLMNGAKGSKVLVTTRSPRVVETMAREFHMLNGLEEEDALSLLMRTAKKEENELKNKNIELTAKEILKKCGGVPLAIMNIGGLLRFSVNTEEDWLNFKNNDLSRINKDDDSIGQSLRLSYDFLQPHLKQCFAYCSLFPEDYDLEPSRLIHLWMANGFIKPLDHERAPEEVGREYFNELVKRYFFQDIRRDVYGNIIACKMHDLMHDLAETVAGDNCITMKGSQAEHVQVIYRKKEARHVAMVDLDDYKLKIFEGEERIRTLFLFTNYSSEVVDPHLDVSCFRNLRVLRVHDLYLHEISSSIGELKHLRSLEISWNRMLEALPDTISKLCNLWMLNLKGCSKLKRLPRGITKLVNLRQLDVSKCGELMHMPKGIGRMTSLQILPTFVVGAEGDKDAASLNELCGLAGLKNKELCIRHLERFSGELDDSLSIQKFALQSLKLHWDFLGMSENGEEVMERLRRNQYHLRGLEIEGYDGAALPSWVSQMHNLVEITINHCYSCVHLPPLHQLPSLKKIVLSSMRRLEYIQVSGDTPGGHEPFFPSLEELKLWDLPEFRGWERKTIERGGEEETQEKEDSSASMIIPTFPHMVKVRIDECPRFSFMHGQDLKMSLKGTTCKHLFEMMSSRNRKWDAPPPLPPLTNQSTKSTMVMTSISASLPAVTSLSIVDVDVDVENLPVVLFRTIASLRSLEIDKCPLLKALPLKAILRYLPSFEKLIIRDCMDLDLSLYDDDDDDDDDGNGNGNEGKDMCDPQQLQLFDTRLCCLMISRIPKMESLPEWIPRLPNLRELEIRSCDGLKSIPGRVILQLLTTLEKLSLNFCGELDLSGDSEDQEDMQVLMKSCGPPKLRELSFQRIDKMKTLPWWIQLLTNLEELDFWHCDNLQALPEWFPKQLTSLTSFTVSYCGELSRRCQRDTGDDWPKISHIPHIDTEF